MKKLLLALMICSFPLSSMALFEARVGYGQNTFDEDSYFGAEMKTMRGYNADLIFEPPLITNFGFGLRYEVMGFDISPGGDVDMERLSFLVNYRVIDTLAYLGFIATYGLSNKLEFNTGLGTLKYDDKRTYTVGIEGGITLGIITVGAELGKFFGKFDSPVGGAGQMDLESIYMKAIVGVGF